MRPPFLLFPHARFPAGRLLPAALRALVRPAVAAVAVVAAAGWLAGAEPAGPAREFVARYGPRWFEHLHPDVQSAYPFGRSNRAHDAELAKVFDAGTVSRDVAITGARYLYEGDGYAVQWFYHATFVHGGARQVEATLAFGRVQDGQLIEWKEYFDDAVGELQAAATLPLYAPDEEPFPWPAGAKLNRPYRP